MKIGIVNYSLGNVGSVYSAFTFYKYDVCLLNSPEELKQVDVIVLAGVGHFKTAESTLKASGFWDALNEEVLVKKKLVIGLCLGMQLFAGQSFEDGQIKGFGWIEGDVVRIPSESVRVPHIGWNTVEPVSRDLFQGMRYNSFYFMHSYHFLPKESDVVIATTQYGDLELVSAVRKENIVGTQFHPEKSQGDGLRLLHNIVEVVA